MVTPIRPPVAVSYDDPQSMPLVNAAVFHFREHMAAAFNWFIF